MSGLNKDSLGDSAAEEPADAFYGVKARPQRSRVAKKTEATKSRSKRIKRTSPIGGLHQRRNKKINW